MEKLKMHSPDFTEENIEKLAALFPNCVTESEECNHENHEKHEKKILKKAIDFDLLRQELSGTIVEGPQERYHLNWPGKREALLTANAPIAKTLRPCRKESVDFDTTQNLFIEGDNLDALKLLQETYLGKVKMIYIDPPYNTGKDFIYRDNFSESTEEYLLESGQKDEDGNRLVANTDSNGRFHSDWLSMMYPRLKLARNLLRDDGVIFISIDSGEVHNLRKMCDEVFGVDNFISDFIWKKRTGSNDSKNMASIDHDFVIAYGKSTSVVLEGIKKDTSNYKNPNNDPMGSWVRGDLTCNKTASERPNLFYPITDPETGVTYQCNPSRVWVYERVRMAQAISEGKIIFPSDPKGTLMYKRHLSELRSTMQPISSLLKTRLNTFATKETRELLEGQYFDYPKGIHLISILLQQAALKPNDIVLDFFAGSATTAHAVMQLNVEDGGNRKFIMVQLPEVCNEKSEAYKAGYKTIAEISKERIRRAGKKIKEELTTKDTKNTKEEPNLFTKKEAENFRDFCGFRGSEKELDIGFRVLKVDSSNMADVYYKPDTVKQDLISMMIDNIKDDRSSEDLLFQVLLDWGVDLTLPISKETICVKGEGGEKRKKDEFEVFFVDSNALAACFVKEGEITEAFCKELAKREPLRVVFRDAGFKDDSVKINIEQIFKLMSPHTDIKTI